MTFAKNWKWANKYLEDKTINAINTRDRCFHLYVNENYKVKEALL